MRNAHVFAALVLALFAGVLRAEPAPPDDAQLQLFLLIGQSNMAGRGKVEPQDRVPHPRVWMLDKDDHWVPATDPLHFDKPKVAGVGLGSQFGRTIAESDPSIHVGLIPSAVGGTTIEQWRKGGELYDNAVRRARIAMQHGKLASILWHQGESDTAAPKQAVYAEKLEQLIADLRKDLNAPDVPFILGQLGPFRTVTGNDTMNDLLLHIPDTHPNTACATSEGLTSIGDGTHFDAASLREFGYRYAVAYRKLIGKPAPPPYVAPTTRPGEAKDRAPATAR
jgi:hypothetical protein